MSNDDDAQAASETNEEAVENTEVEGESTEASAQNNSDESNQQPTSESKEDGSNSLPDDPEVLKREIAKLRKENAARRTKNKDVEDAAKKWQEHLDSQKTEMEKLQDRLTNLQKENEDLKVSELRRNLADEFDLDSDLVEFITGADLDEMRDKAKRLSEKTKSTKKKAQPTAKDMKAGQSGEFSDSSRWLRELFQ